MAAGGGRAGEGSGEDTSPDFVTSAEGAAPSWNVVFFTSTCGALQQTQWGHAMGDAGQIVSGGVGHGKRHSVGPGVGGMSGGEGRQ